MLLALLLLAQALPAAPASANPEPIVTTASGLRFQVITPGAGRRPTRADGVEVSYEVRLVADGRVVERTRAPVGVLVGRLVPGFTEALLRMNEGGSYRFWVPARLAYGARGNPGSVPPFADLMVNLELLRVGRPARR